MTEFRAYTKRKQITVVSLILSVVTFAGLDLAGAFSSVEAPMAARLFYLLCALIGLTYFTITLLYLLHPGPVLVINDAGVHFPHRLKSPLSWAQIKNFNRAVDSSGFETITFDLRDPSAMPPQTIVGMLISVPLVTLPGPRINPRVMNRSLDEVERELRRHIR